MTTHQTLGTKLRRAREDAGMEQRAAAKAVGVHEVTLSKYENGRSVPSEATLAKLWALYGQPATAPDPLTTGAFGDPVNAPTVAIPLHVLAYWRGRVEEQVNSLHGVGAQITAVGDSLAALRVMLERATGGVAGILSSGILPPHAPDAPQGPPPGRPVMTEADVEAQVSAFRQQEQADAAREERSA